MLILAFAMTTAAQTNKFPNFKETFKRELAPAGIAGASFVFVKEGATLAEEH